MNDYAYFTTWKRQPETVAALNKIIQGKKESMWSYIDWFTQVAIKIKEPVSVGYLIMVFYM